MDFYDSEKSSSCLIKIVMVGDTSVGKTNLVRRHIDNQFDPDSEPTIGTLNTLKLSCFLCIQYYIHR